MITKTKLNNIEAVISKALTDSYVNHEKFVLVTNMLREYNEMSNILKTLRIILYKYGINKQKNLLKNDV